MYKSPQRISISPVYRQKSDIDYYLVDRDVYPGKGTEYVREDLFDTLTAENKRLRGALLRISCPHVIFSPLWWQEAAREAIAKAKGA